MSDDTAGVQLHLGGPSQYQGIAGKRVSVPFVDEETRNPVTTELFDLYLMYAGIKAIGVMNAAVFVRFGVRLAGVHITPDIEEDIDDLLIGIKLMSKTRGEVDEIRKHARTPPPVNPDTVLAFTYEKLRQKELTYAEAAEFASGELRKDIKPNTWRMRVDRWAEKQGLPKVEQRKRSKK